MSSKEYLEALKSHILASYAFSAAKHAHHHKLISDAEYLLARKAMSRADAAYDVALARELSNAHA